MLYSVEVVFVPDAIAAAADVPTSGSALVAPTAVEGSDDVVIRYESSCGCAPTVVRASWATPTSRICVKDPIPASR